EPHMTLSEPIFSHNTDSHNTDDRMVTIPIDSSDQSTIGRAIRAQSEKRPDQPAMIWSERAPLSYRGLQQFIDEFRVSLRAAGFTRSARIVVALPGGAHAALAIIGVACSAVAIPLDPKLTLAEIGKRVALLRPDAVVLLEGTDSAARRVAE